MKNKTLFSAAFSVIFFLSFQHQSQATVYKWEDRSGQTHYSDQPSEPDAESFSIRNNTTTKPRGINRTEKTPDRTLKAESNKTEMVEVDFSARQKRQFCKEATNDIKVISSRGRMREINKKGEYTYLSEQQRQQRLSAARKKQREFCR